MMDAILIRLFDNIEQKSGMILDAERHIWKNPEPGYREWKTHAYLKALLALRTALIIISPIRSQQALKP